MNEIFTPMYIMLALGLAAAIGLCLASIVFAVKENPLIAAVEEALLGANCGGCGYAGCSQAAEAVVNGVAAVDVCTAGGPAIAQAVAAVMGQEVKLKEREIASLRCKKGYRIDRKFEYEGIRDCRAAVELWEGARNCGRACIGLGTCEKVCPFGAIKIGEECLPVIDANACTGCGTCVKNCPKEVLELVSMTKRLLAFNRVDDCLAPCRQTCPAQIDIPTYIDHVKYGRYKEALMTIKERNPMPLTCGRVCPHPCEYVCRRGLADEPVAINYLKRFAADYELELGEHFKIDCNPDTGHKVAVIGGGPGGLSAAFFLRRLGHSVTIFDMMPELGGMTRYGIPEYRLPKKILDFEIEGILDLGVEAKCNTKFGEDFTIKDLRDQGYEAIFMSIGAWKSSPMRVENEDAEGCLAGIRFLEKQGLKTDNPIGRRVAVIGGGNTAIDVSRTMLRLGADEVTIIYRRTRKEMPAEWYEIEEAEQEGIKFHFLAAPSKIITDDKGRFSGLEFIRMELGEPDSSGRRRPVPIEGSEEVVELDNIVAAIGQKPDLDDLPNDEIAKDLDITKWQTIIADEQTLQTSIPYIFTGGDCFTGALTVVSAIGAGRRAARSIHLYLDEDAELVAPPKPLTDKIPESTLPHIDGVALKSRVDMPEVEPHERIKSFEEVALGLYEDDAIYEAGRCLQCGIRCYDMDIKISQLMGTLKI